jgi:RNA polymerase sigma factor (sigma-70 family)
LGELRAKEAACGGRRRTHSRCRRRRLPGFRAGAVPGRPLAPWLFTIARRAAIDLYRRRARGPEPIEPKDDATISLPPSMECIWEAWQIRIALDMLPAEEREVVRAQHFAGLTHAQIAQQLAMPIGTVKSRSHRAHRRLALMLGHLAEAAA